MSPEESQRLLTRLEELEREVKALKEQLRSDASPPVAVLTEPPIAAPDTEAEIIPVEAADPNRRITFRGYADGGLSTNQKYGSKTRFTIGEVDLFARVRLSSKVSLLAETVLETDNQRFNNEVPINLERIFLRYQPHPFIRFDFGRFRTNVGYYSNNYLRASWLQTAVSRPRFYTFEDDGGIMSLHTTGVSINGQVPLGPIDLRYAIETGNSGNDGPGGGSIEDRLVRAGLFPATPNDMALTYARGLNFSGAVLPKALPGLEVGSSFYTDHIDALGFAKVKRRVMTAHAVYNVGSFELLNEAVLVKMSHPQFGSGTIPGFYSQWAYNVRPNWKPYFRYEYANMTATNVAASILPILFDWHSLWLGGLRVDLTDSVALKTEFGAESDYIRRQIHQRGAIQLAFTF